MGEKSYTHRIACSKSTKLEIDECKKIFQNEKGLHNQYISYDTILLSMIKIYRKY